MVQFSSHSDRVTRDGEQHLIVSGALHYFRVHPDLWLDRLRRLRAMGANTVETYVPWNYHAPERRTIDFSGRRDLGRFLDLAAEADLDIIVRPGPYICAEWEGGGLPGWLLADTPRSQLRSSFEPYLDAVARWLTTVCPIIAERQRDHGGRVVMVQVENEYGSYGDDPTYLEFVRDALKQSGITVPLVTSDGPGDQWLLAGTVAGAAPTINFGSRAAAHLESFRRLRPDTPAMCMEFWNGWFDHWGEPHHVRDPQDAAAELATMLEGGMHVNFYMAHGGTNFGLWNGCNHDQVLQPTVTSYDYDAPISEDGTLTEKFYAFREVIGRHLELPELPDDLVAEPARLGPRALERVGSFVLTPDRLQALSEETVAWVAGARIPERPSPQPPTFEEVGLERGMLLLRSAVDHPGGPVDLKIFGLHDRAHVLLDGALVGIVGRDEGQPEALTIDAPAGRYPLDLIVESQGRINFGPLLLDSKGVTKGVWFGTRYVMGWRAYPLALDVIGADVLGSIDRSLDGYLDTSDDGSVNASVNDESLGEERAGLVVDRYELTVADNTQHRAAFISTRDQGRGFLYVDDEMLGRYWDIGPQQTLYCPGPLLGAGRHTVTLVRTDPGQDEGMLYLAEGPDLGPVQRFVPEG
ncbi:glycoside hydrolase family 35 protein [Ornithinimicrobium sp. Y1847]|uniref:glycoside hydrolase family 35 protein n=1 Tax=Ornithinimicrobium sp. Y1847 TaxID=3405419 RepID=UPI003B67547A